MRYFVFLVLAAIVITWLVQRALHDKQAEGGGKKESLHEQIHEVTDYATGKTQADILIQQTVNLRMLEIKDAVKYFEGMNGRAPKSLDELQQEGLITEEQKYIRYGKVKYEIESGLTPDGRFFIRGLGKDRRKGTQDDWQYVL